MTAKEIAGQLRDAHTMRGGEPAAPRFFEQEDTPSVSPAPSSPLSSGPPSGVHETLTDWRPALPQ